MKSMSIAEAYQRYSIWEAKHTRHIITATFRWVVEHNCTRIRLQKLSTPTRRVREDDPGYSCSDGGKYTAFTIEFDDDCGWKPGGQLPIHRWYRLVSQLKVLAKTVDYGVRKSEKCAFSVDLDKEWALNLVLLSNPNPYRDNEVVIEVESISPLASSSLAGEN